VIKKKLERTELVWEWVHSLGWGAPRGREGHNFREKLRCRSEDKASKANRESESLGQIKRRKEGGKGGREGGMAEAAKEVACKRKIKDTGTRGPNRTVVSNLVGGFWK